MEEIRLKNIKNNIDCVELWSYLNTNRNATLKDLEDKFDNEDWQKLRKGGMYFCSNLVYCLRKLKTMKAIEIIQNKNDGGRFDYSTINILNEPIIVDIVISITCTECNCEFRKKNSQSKHQELCHECTKKKFMVSPDTNCFHCTLPGPRNKMKFHSGECYHRECYAVYLENKKVELLKQKELARIEKESKRYYCKDCSQELTFASRRKDCCGDCAKKRNREIVQQRTGNIHCVSCGEKITTRNNKSGLCNKDNCLAVFYLKSDTFFNSRSGSKDSRSPTVKKLIIGLDCAVCNYDKVIQYHHVIFKENGGTDSLNNIIALCPNHHQEIHKCDLDISPFHQQVLRRLDDIKNGLISI